MAKKRKKNYRKHYDKFYITKFRTLHPEKVNKYRESVKKRYPYASEMTIEKYVDEKIFPSVLEEPIRDPRIYSEGIIYLGTANGIDALNCDQIVHVEEMTPKKELLLDSMHTLIDSLNEEDQKMFRMSRGLEPYERAYSQTEIASELGMLVATVSYRLKKIYLTLQKEMCSIRETIKEETNIEFEEV